MQTVWWVALCRLSFAGAGVIMHVVVDDLGWDDLGFRSHQIDTPFIDSLAHDGVVLGSLYTMPVCSPSRSSMMTGKYPMRFGLQHQVIWAGAAAGVPLGERMIPQYLHNYSSHAIGKWHMGYYSWAHTPTFRGFQSFYGFYGGGEDYYTHRAGAGSESPGPQLGSGFDFRWDRRSQCGANCSVALKSANGGYSTELFGARAVEVVQQHNTDQALYIYLAFQAVHAPEQVPAQYERPYIGRIADSKRRTFAGMLTAVDQALANVSEALEARGMLNDTLWLVTTDNGGQVPGITVANNGGQVVRVIRGLAPAARLSPTALALLPATTLSEVASIRFGKAECGSRT